MKIVDSSKGGGTKKLAPERMNNWKYMALVTLFMFTWPDAALANPSGNESPRRELSYEEAIQEALGANADLMILREQEKSFRAKSSQAVGPNEPTVSWTKTDVSAKNFGQAISNHANQDVYTITWTVGFPGKAYTNGSALDHQAAASAEQASQQEMTLISSLANLYVSLSTNQSQYELLLEEQRKDGELKKLLEKKYAASQAAKVDLLNAEVVTQNIGLSLLDNRNEYEVLLTQFRQILKQPSNNSLFPRIPGQILVPEVAQSYDALAPTMLKNNHQLRATEAQLKSSRSLLTNAKLQALPDFQLLAGANSYNNNGGPNGSYDYNVGIGITVPIFFFFNEYHGVQAAKHDLLASEYQLTSAQLQALSVLQGLLASLQAARKHVDASERLVVPAAKASFDLTMTTYGYGKADYFALNQSRQAWHDARKDLINRRQNLAQNYYQLIAQVGCDLQKSEGPYACQ